MLRNVEQRRGVAAATLGRVVLPGFSHRDASWLAGLLAGLERDELIYVHGTGTPMEKRVALR